MRSVTSIPRLQQLVSRPNFWRRLQWYLDRTFYVRKRQFLGRTLYGIAPFLYHHWMYDTLAWKKMTWLGLPIQKSPCDLWNYQEIFHELKPSLVIEFGTFHGGSAVFFASILRAMGKPFRVLSVDINPCTASDPDVDFLVTSSTDPSVTVAINKLKTIFPGRVFAILDGDHTKEHVLAEMLSLRPLLGSADYLIVEDSNINGHPVLKSHGPGPYEAIQEYFGLYPDDYKRDVDRETKFGFTFAPQGFLIRK